MATAQQIQLMMKDLRNIEQELKRLNSQVKIYRDQKKDIETQISKYLEEKDQPGLKYQDLLVLTGESKRRTRKKKEERELDLMSILESKGIRNARETVNEIMETMKGKQVIRPVLKIKNSGITE
jgi:hypothetical protein